MNEVVLSVQLPGQLYNRGKVRDTYNLTDDLLLIIATDRISAFDVVLPTGIPNKGPVLNQLSAFWFEKTRHLIDNHLVQVVNSVDVLNKYFLLANSDAELAVAVGRSMIVRRIKRINVECIARGYLTGSAWEKYKKTGTAYDYKLPKGMLEGQVLPGPIFTPTTKADSGHDQPLTMKELESMVGADLARALRLKTIEVYTYARQYAWDRGIIIADTKMEFGFGSRDKLCLIDELLTPDSSRFWPADAYKPGGRQPSYDKQLVRDWLEKSGWDKEPPAPNLPDYVIKQTSQKYIEAYERLTGTKWPPSFN